jgi:general secretion pathway protein A
MYAQFFGLTQEPFSIAPDPRYLFMSERHREALAHLLFGVGGGGGFVLLSGEVGAGKTTVCRCFLEQVPRRCNVAYIFNPKLSVRELLKSVCDEFHIPYTHLGLGAPTVKDYVDPLNEFLLKTHAVGQNNLLVIDEAQMLSAAVLEQLRLLTNLETNERKLLQIILIGQPELRDMLARPELEQLSQRVIARFHLEALSEAETEQYIAHRLAVAGRTTASPFDRKALQRIHKLSRGVPRRINLLCDRALLGAYALGRASVDRTIVDKAASEVFGKVTGAAKAASRNRRAALLAGGVAIGALAIGVVTAVVLDGSLRRPSQAISQTAPNGPAGTAAKSALPGASAASASVVPVMSASEPARAAASSVASAGPAGTAAVASAPAQRIAVTADPAQILQSTTRDENRAWRALASAWTLELGQGDPCQAAQRQQVHCFRTDNSLALIRQLDRPGILTLRHSGTSPVFAVLTGLTDQTAMLRLDGVSQTVSLAVLATLWQGEFATFWRAPPGYAAVIDLGSRGDVVDRLAVQLAALDGSSSPARGRPFDESLKAKVRAFQLAQGLKPDGRAGPTTFMQLNRASGVQEPRLTSQASAP